MRLRDVIWIERRAAEIAVSMVVDGRWPVDMLGPEMAGWMRYADNRERGGWPKPREWHAGWLAAIIWSEAFEYQLGGAR